jgi:type IV pilus assembly protein PilA
LDPSRCSLCAWGGTQTGFTLIELMIVVAVIGILAALSIPFYQSFTTRAKVSEGLVLLAPVKTAVVEYHATHGDLPAAGNWLSLLKELGLPVSAQSGAAAGSFVERIWWNGTENEIRIRYGVAPIDGKVLYLQADFDDSGPLAWRCYAPSDEDEDGVPVQYLPSSCRG